MIRKTPERPGNEGDADQPPVPALNVEVTIPLKYLSNLQRFLDLPLINCKIELDLSWKKDRVLPECNNNITGATFQINNAKLCVTIVTLSINDNIRFLENIKQGFKRAISWNKYRSGKTTQPKHNNLYYLIDRLEILIDYLYFHLKMLAMIILEALLINVTCHQLPLIDNKLFFGHPIKNKQKAS